MEARAAAAGDRCARYSGDFELPAASGRPKDLFLAAPRIAAYDTCESAKSSDSWSAPDPRAIASSDGLGRHDERTHTDHNKVDPQPRPSFGRSFSRVAGVAVSGSRHWGGRCRRARW